MLCRRQHNVHHLGTHHLHQDQQPGGAGHEEHHDARRGGTLHDRSDHRPACLLRISHLTNVERYRPSVSARTADRSGTSRRGRIHQVKLKSFRHDKNQELDQEIPRVAEDQGRRPDASGGQHRRVRAERCR